ncbi:MAG: MMPL family transporter [Polaromonas sp.]|uniref:MMPL family transporter n=1 Tax=Polaromonas sp. TaxID=1869339 RepID=UPI002731128A|nr:MMPL family transporter [Polaromonas sp.]MDP2450786.1 MMPL family transporter [Polaromonas sp.]MDP3247724.1 MMPL family transporter [Polaromonas sp.]MDP3757803.1 MMPL family transporter [Polaromonas sp.]
MNRLLQRRFLPVWLWLAFLLACGAIISRTQITTDLSAFMPRNPTAEQQLLMDQLKDGLASRLILVGIEGEDGPARARLSKEVARTLRADPAFVAVNNGEPVNKERDRTYLFNNRYLLSPLVTPERFSTDGLHAALAESIDLLASPAGLMVKSLLPRDPTGEMVQLLGQLDSGTQPRLIDGAWASRDGARALMLMQTRADGSDTDAQQSAMAAIRQAFDTARRDSPAAMLVMTGPGVFSVTSREAIKSQVSRLSLISVVIIATLLLLVYRSATALALGFLPVLSGVLAGVAAVSLGFGAVHGITLGFGTALIGEAVDYSIYLFVQSEKADAGQDSWVKRFWPTIRLGVLTSIFGFASLLLSGFPGLAQLGLYAIAGLVAAAVMTRFVLPHLLPAQFRIHDVSAIGRVLSQLTRRAAALRWPAALLLLAACAVLATHRDTLLNEKISSLSPVSQADIALDESLRADMGAPDVRYVVVISGTSRESVLVSAEQVSALLQAQVDQGELAGFESPSRYLPGMATQRARQASLPPAEVLQPRLAQAVQGLPVRAEVFAPFLADVETSRSRPLLQASDLEQTSLAMAVDALLLQTSRGGWTALLPLRAPEGAGIQADRIRAALGSNSPDVLFVDMKAESDRLYSGYLREATLLSLGGLLSIVVLLLLVFRSPTRVLRIIAPLAASVITVTAGLALAGQPLIILHLVGLLLVVAVGSNYALFFDRPDPLTPISHRTLASMALANLTTVAGFGLLAFSKISILQAMGATVAPGVILALVYAAIFARQPHDAQA